MGLAEKIFVEAVDIKYDGAKQHAQQVPRTGPVQNLSQIDKVFVVIVVVEIIVVGVEVVVVLF